MSDYLDPNNEELLKDFFSEAQMQVEVMERSILTLEDDPNNQDAIDETFRAAHTLKGGAATVQMDELSSFTHLLEDLLDEIRGGKIKVTEENTDSLLSSIDIIKAMISARMDGGVYSDDYSGISADLRRMITQKGDAAEPPQKKQVQAPSPEPKRSEQTAKGLSEYELLELRENAGDGEKVLKVSVNFDESNPMNSVGGIQVYARIKGEGQILKTVPDFDTLYQDVFHPVVQYYLSTENSQQEVEKAAWISDVTASVEVESIDETQLPVTPPAKPEQAQAPPRPEKPVVDTGKKVSAPPPKTMKKEGGSGPVLRVDSRRIDNLLNLVSESVISKATFNQINTQFNENIVQLTSAETEYKNGLKSLLEILPQWLSEIKEGRPIKEIKADINERYGGMYNIFDTFESQLKNTINMFRNTAANLGRNTGNLHEAILRIRMVPIGQIFSRFPRLVRDLSKSLDKQLELIIEGEDTELDKSVTEELLDPLMHCVRNSMDHGIESPDIRVRAGKPEKGRLFLKAANEGNMIVIEIVDDGKGIDVEKVRKKAIDRGIIHPSKPLTDVEAFNLIFEAGFSTAVEVTNISGRGVGLDVVRKQIEKLNGSVSVWSKVGEGTRFTIKLPLTLAIIQGLLIRVGKEIYAIPITSVIESHRIKTEEIDVIDNHEVFNVREDVISLLRLGTLFRIHSRKDSEYNYVVVVGGGDKKMGLVVDALIGEEDVVIKPLKDRYTNSPGIAGATILGDGTVALIMDVSQLLELSLSKEQEARQNRVVH